MEWQPSREKKEDERYVFCSYYNFFSSSFQVGWAMFSFEVTVTNLAEYFPNFLRYSKLRNLLAPKWGEHNWDFKIELL